LLTDYCLQIAAAWDLNEVVGETEPHNARMIATFRHAGFELDYTADDVVIARKQLKVSSRVSLPAQTLIES
jgi:RimJ/RimL family protein N-acetyltransferase